MSRRFEHLRVGATLVVDNQTSELVEAATYQPYGAPESDLRFPRWDNFREDYKFSGKEDDIDVGVTYFGGRYYSSALNRWMSADPVAVQTHKGDLNVYSYVSGRVFFTTDPTGLDPWSYTIPVDTDTPQAYTIEGGGAAQDPAQMYQQIALVDYFAQNTAGAFTNGLVSGTANGLAFGVPGALGMGPTSLYGSAGFKVGTLFGTAVGTLLTAGADGAAQAGAAGASFATTATADVAAAAADTVAISRTTESALATGSDLGMSASAGLPTESVQGVGGGFCFAAGTLVTMCDGSEEPIETLREHDRVASAEEDGTVACHAVVRLFERTAEDRAVVAVAGADRAAPELIHTTLNHPSRVDGRGWVVVADLRAGDVVRSLDGAERTVRATVLELGQGEVFNFEVEGSHSYFVGEARVLVHNQCFEPESQSALASASDAANNLHAPTADLEHVLERHAYGSPALKAGKFAADADIPSLIKQTVANGTIGPGNASNPSGIVFQQTFPNAIGTTMQGGDAFRLRVVLRPDGSLQTAFPF